MGKNMIETIAPVALGLGAMALTGGAAAPALAGTTGAAGAGAGAAGAGAAGAAAGAGAGATGATGASLGGAFGSADMLASSAAGSGLLGTTGAASAAPGTIESAGLLDMGGGNLVNPEYFVGEGMGMPMYAGSPDAPFMERAGNVLGSMGDQMGGMDPSKALRMMNMGGQPQQQQMARPAAMQRPQSQPATQIESPYSQPISGGVQLTDEQKALLRQRMMGGQYGGIIG